jgi:multicomponent Na+:H+ antiporter subunit E
VKRVGSSFLANLLLTLGWVALTGEFAAWNFAVGFLMGLLVLSLSGRDVGAYYVRKIIQSGRFLLFFLWELIKANAKIASYVLRLSEKARPAFLALPLEVRTDLEIALLANLITLTPGTLSLDVSSDRKYLFLHAMFVDDPEQFKRQIKEDFESRVLELLR